jgi:hypothetical protein
MNIELYVLVLLILLVVILTVYNHRQASALKGVESLVQDFISMQIRDRRAQHSEDVAGRIDPFEWISRQVSSGLTAPLVVSDTGRIVPEARAVEFRTLNGPTIVVSPFSKSELLRFDRRLRSVGSKSAKDRVAAFASRPLLGNSRWGWGITSIERVTSKTDEFFDIEASAVAERLGVKWETPTRLWFHVVR